MRVMVASTALSSPKREAAAPSWKVASFFDCGATRVEEDKRVIMARNL